MTQTIVTSTENCHEIDLIKHRRQDVRVDDTHQIDDGQQHQQQIENGDCVINESKSNFQSEIVWRNVVLLILYHIAGFWGLYLLLFQAKGWTILWTVVLTFANALGVTAGAHRLWAHKSYKAKLPLQLILLFFNTVAFQNSVIVWVRDHRVHHKFSETDADPHNAKRGFFFSHMGWLLVRKHPDVKIKGAKVSVQDLQDDPLLAFQHKHYVKLTVTCCFIIPTLVPVMFWQESTSVAFFTAGVWRYISSLHWTWCINSVAHLFGNRPYDKNIYARQNRFASLVSLGEGWHNYHHCFPNDYKASEMPYTLNPTTAFIDFFAWIGWAYDRKSTSPEMILRKKLRCGEH